MAPVAGGCAVRAGVDVIAGGTAARATPRAVERADAFGQFCAVADPLTLSTSAAERRRGCRWLAESVAAG